MQGTVERIKQVLVSQLGVDPDIVAQSRAETPLIGRGIGLDSVEAMALAVGIEEAFEIEIPDDDLTADLFQSIAALADYVTKKRAEQ
jgi:acyl carrier protein